MASMIGRVALSFIAACIAPSIGAQGLGAQSLDGMVAKAKFIFTGDVMRLNASTLPTVPPTPKLAVVRITDVLSGEELFGAFPGEEITVEMLEPAELKKTVFFTNVAVYGNSLEVIELGHLPMGDDGVAEIRAKLAAARKRVAEQAILARMNTADRVIAGKVESVRRLGNAQRRSEHAPLWAIAVINVSSVLKGGGDDRVEVMFPTSRDELWAEAPHFEKGESGVWILRRGKHERGLSRPTGALTALAPGDFQPMSELSRLRALIGGRR